jgi:hypothetical protein
MIAFAEAFRPLEGLCQSFMGFPFDPRVVSLPATIGLVALVLTKGAELGVKALWGVAAVLAVSLAMFFLGSSPVDMRPDGGHAGERREDDREDQRSTSGSRGTTPATPT